MTSTRDVGHLVAQANYHLEVHRTQKQYAEQRYRSALQVCLQCQGDLINATSNFESEEKKVKAFYAQVAPYYEYGIRKQTGASRNVSGPQYGCMDSAMTH
jgi:hypothetical protein